MTFMAASFISVFQDCDIGSGSIYAEAEITLLIDRHESVEKDSKKAAHNPRPHLAEAAPRRLLSIAAKRVMFRHNLAEKKQAGRGPDCSSPIPAAFLFYVFLSRMNIPVLVSSSTLSEGFLVARLTSIIAATDKMKPYMLGCMGRAMTLVYWA